MREAGVIFNHNGEPIFWHHPENRNTVILPDSKILWDAMWENKHEMMGFAHSHPGSGQGCPSSEDLSTFKAVESGIGKKMLWPIITSNSIWVYSRVNLTSSEYSGIQIKQPPKWLNNLRRLSEY